MPAAGATAVQDVGIGRRLMSSGSLNPWKCGTAMYCTQGLDDGPRRAGRRVVSGIDALYIEMLFPFSWWWLDEGRISTARDDRSFEDRECAATALSLNQGLPDSRRE